MTDDMEIDEPSGSLNDTAQTTESTDKTSVIVKKPVPYTFDLGNLLVSDNNPLQNPEKPTNDEIAAVARDCAQALINQLLETCPISKGDGGDLHIELPAPTTLLPREKSLPAAREETKWERFARKKGIQAKRRDERSNKVYDEASGEWVPRWGYKGKNKQLDDQWLVEVDEKREQEAEAKGATIRSIGRRERKDAVKRNERKHRANDRRSRKSTGA